MIKLGRPKGSKQKRNEDKYKLPNDLSLKEGQTEDYNKDTRLIFIDSQFGEFESTFKNISRAGASTHPKAVIARREQTNKEIYGTNTPLKSDKVKEKIRESNLEKYGVENISQSQSIKDKKAATWSENQEEKAKIALEKRINTMKDKYGVDNGMLIDEAKERLKETNLLKFGTENVFQNDEIKEKSRQTMVQKFGVEYNSQREDLIFIRDETKYWLPIGVLLKNGQIIDYTKETKLVFIDEKYGEFISSFHALQSANSSTHPKATKEKRIQTYLREYGVDHHFKNSNIKEKIAKTLIGNGTVRTSKGEKEILQFVKSLGIEAKPGFIGGINPKQIDVKVNDLKIGIEYCGTYWHSEASTSMYPSYHKDKREEVKKSGYKLIQIWEYEWKERTEQVKSFLRSSLGKNEIKVHARKTQIVEIDKKEAQEFLDQYHILGSCNFSKAVGLKYNNELLCLVTVGRHHRKSHEFVLNRYVGKTNVTVVGGLSKLSKYIVQDLGVIKTWIDLRYSDGENWIKNGWELEEQLKPDYFYYNIKTRKIISKQMRKKDVVNTPDNITEHEHALLDGLRRVYDCGKLRLVYRKK